MSLTLDLSNDWQSFDFLEEISYSQRIDDTDFYPPQSVTALKRDTQKKFNDFSSVELSRKEGIWQIWTSSMTSAFAPKRGDKFERLADSSIWVVESVDFWIQTTLWVLQCYEEQTPIEDDVGFLLLETGGGLEFN